MNTDEHEGHRRKGNRPFVAVPHVAYGDRKPKAGDRKLRVSVVRRWTA